MPPQLCLGSECLDHHRHSSPLLLWLVLFIFLGIKTLRKGHWVMFLIGIVLPIFWIIGALIPARR